MIFQEPMTAHLAHLGDIKSAEIAALEHQPAGVDCHVIGQ